MIDLSLTRRAHSSGLLLILTRMAWRPYENLIDGELDNTEPGAVTGWIRFCRRGQSPLRVRMELAGDFHEDIRGKVIRLKNPQPSDEHIRLDRAGTYMQGFARVQHGNVGDMTAGLALGPWTDQIAQKLMAQNERHWDETGLLGQERERRRQEFAEQYRAHVAARDLYYPYVKYPYFEWYADNGRVVLELGPSQVEILENGAPVPRDIPLEELHAEHTVRESAQMERFAQSLEKALKKKGRRDQSAA